MLLSVHKFEVKSWNLNASFSSQFLSLFVSDDYWSLCWQNKVTFARSFVFWWPQIYCYWKQMAPWNQPASLLHILNLFTWLILYLLCENRVYSAERYDIQPSVSVTDVGQLCLVKFIDCLCGLCQGQHK